MAAAAKAVSDRGLKAAGFRRQGLHLHRLYQGLIHGIHFQSSQWGTATSGSFTVNLGVTSPWLYTSWTSRPMPSNPATALYPVCQRIGALMPSRCDQWWKVDANTDLPAVGGEVADAVMAYGLPFLDMFASSDVLLSGLRETGALPGLIPSQAPLVHAMLAVEKGLLSEAREQIQRAFGGAGSSPFRGTVEIIAKRLGLSTDA
jgi:hypothetical protein